MRYIQYIQEFHYRSERELEPIGLGALAGAHHVRIRAHWQQ